MFPYRKAVEQELLLALMSMKCVDQAIMGLGIIQILLVMSRDVKSGIRTRTRFFSPRSDPDPFFSDRVQTRTRFLFFWTRTGPGSHF
jgi:hypothetical protein